MKRRALTAVLAGLLLTAVAAPAQAQSSSTTGVLFAFGTGVPGTPVSGTEIRASVTGQLTVTFHGDPGTGCAAHGLCGYAGTVTVEPGSGAAVSILKLVSHGHAVYEAALVLGAGPQGSATYAEVSRSSDGSQSGLCADVQQSLLTPTFTSGRGLVSLALLQSGGSLLATRCAGPLDGDVAEAIPPVTLPVQTLLRGRRQLDLSGHGTFAQAGFAGSVDSTIVLGLGRANTQKLSSSGASFPRPIKTKRLREVTEKLTLMQASGTISALVSGTSDQGVCVLLDSCGLAGTLTVTPGPIGASGELVATGLGTLPFKDFLAALGRGGAGNARGIDVTGGLSWNDQGSISSDLSQAGPCTDAASLGAGGVGLTMNGNVLSATYTSEGLLRTRCPGPLLGATNTLAAGALSRRDLRHHTFTVHLHSGAPIQDDGYSVGLRGGLSLTLRALPRLSQRVIVQPVP